MKEKLIFTLYPRNMNGFDTPILLFINGLARHWGWFDALMHGFTNNYLLKSASIILLYYVAWFKPMPDVQTMRWRQGHLLAGLGAAVLAPILARLLTVVLPFRQRPMNTEGLPFHLPEHMRAEVVDIHWSSFPSDNIALVAPLAIGLFIVSRRMGSLAGAIVVVDCFARMYSGLHFPTDVLGGAVLGALTFCLIDCTPLKQLGTVPAFTLMEKHPGLFYGGFFLITYQIANVFWETFNILNHFLKIGVIHGT